MKKHVNNYKVKSFIIGNNAIEFFSGYGIFFCVFLLIILVAHNSVYFYLFEEIKYITWTLVSLLLFSLISVLYNYFFKLRLSDFTFKIPEEINVGEFFEIKNAIKEQFKNKKDVFIRFKVNITDVVSAEDIEEMKLLYNNTDHKKWGSIWSYGGGLGFNKMAVSPVDFEQVSANAENIRMYAKKRGQLELQGVVLYCFDMFGLFLVKKTYWFDSYKHNSLQLNVLPEKNIIESEAFQSLNKIIKKDGNIVTPNIIGVRKAKRGDSIKNTHWKLFAKKEEHWVFIKEKENSSPLTLLIDLTIEDLKSSSEQFEKMLSDLYFFSGNKKIKKIIMNDLVFNMPDDYQMFKDFIARIPVSGCNENNNKIIYDNKMNSIIILTVNNEKTGKNIINIKKELMENNKQFKVIRYE